MPAADEDQPQIDTEDILLLLISAAAGQLGKTTLRGMTRLQKLVFLLMRETRWKEYAALFEYRPYHFGPFSRQIPESIDFLESLGLIESTEVRVGTLGDDSDEEEGAAMTERQFALTDRGRKVVDYWTERLGKHAPLLLEDIRSVVMQFGAAPLSYIIRYVYRRYPEMAEKSVHREATRMRDK